MGQCSELVILRPTTSMIALAVSEHYFIEILLFLVRICNYILDENNFLEFQGVRLYFATNLKHHCKGRILSRTEYRVASKKKEAQWVQRKLFLLAPLAEGQRAIVMALCPSCVRPSVRACVRASVNFFLKKTSPQKLLTGFLPNFTGMFIWWSSFKFLQIIVFHEEFWLPWQPK